MLLQNIVWTHNLTGVYIILFLLDVECFPQNQRTESLNSSSPNDNETEQKIFGLSDNPNDVMFRLYNDKNNPRKYYPLDYNSNSKLSKAPFVKGKPVILITHGFTSDAVSSTSPVPLLKKAFLNAKYCNIIGVDWSALSSPSRFEFIEAAAYAHAVDNVEIAGKRVGELINKLLRLKVISSSKLFHLIGHSLGAHVMGVAGRTVKILWRSRIKRITGLDPAGPLYLDKHVSAKLTADDAVFVDIVHSDIERLGYAKPIGTVDFYIDYGTYKKCTSLLDMSCAHFYCVEIFAGTIDKSMVRAYGKPCTVKLTASYVPPGSFNGGCYPNNQRSQILFGHCVSMNAKGTYYIDSSSVNV